MKNRIHIRDVTGTCCFEVYDRVAQLYFVNIYCAWSSDQSKSRPLNFSCRFGKCEIKLWKKFKSCSFILNFNFINIVQCVKYIVIIIQFVCSCFKTSFNSIREIHRIEWKSEAPTSCRFIKDTSNNHRDIIMVCLNLFLLIVRIYTSKYIYILYVDDKSSLDSKAIFCYNYCVINFNFNNYVYRML